MTNDLFGHRFGRIPGLGIHLVLFACSVSAFQLRTNEMSSSPPSSSRNEGSSINGGFDTMDALDILPKSTGSPTTVEDDTVDLDKARDFATNYGKYSYEEVKHMRNDLHADRVKNDSPNDILFLERYLEDELSSHLQSLKDEMPDPYLFRYSDGEVPKGLFSSEVSATKTGIKTTEVQSIFFEFPALLLEEGVLETIAVFIVAGVLVMAP